MTTDKYTVKSTLGDVLEEPAALEFIMQYSPETMNSSFFDFIKVTTLQQIMESLTAHQQKLFEALLDVANGREVNFKPVDMTQLSPSLILQGELTYNIDDIDGMMFMLDSQFSGCLIVYFSKKMDEATIGCVTYGEVELPKAVLKTVEAAGGQQMLGIPVRNLLTEYGTEYTLHIKGFTDIDGNVMEPQDITIKTLPKPMPDPFYAEHDDIALQAAREGIVLLKNEGGILPLPAEETLFISGASEFRIGAAGAGRINPRYSIGLLRALNEYSSFKLHTEAETAVFVVSRPSGENRDNNPVKGEYYLSDEEEQSIMEISRHHKNTIAIINTGYPIDLRWTEKYNVQAVIWCGFAGMLGGQALVEILDGRVNPSGKLPDTWSLDYPDIPASANFYTATEGNLVLATDFPFFINTCYEEDIYVGYRYFETFNKPVAYPFGFGLSFTNFETKATFHNMSVSVIVRNTGTMPGKEVVQLYVSIPDGKLEQPSKRLIGFRKTDLLAPGQEQELVIEFTKNNIASYETETASWIVEKGIYKLYIGNSIKNVDICEEFTIPSDEIVKQVSNIMSPPVEMDILSKKNPSFPQGLYSGIQNHVTALTPARVLRREYMERETEDQDFINKLSIEELARLSVCASHGWGMHETGEAGRIYRLEKHDMPAYTVADGNNGVNIKKPNIGMPCSNTVCATFNQSLAYEIGRVIAEEAKENNIQMILAPGMNIHRNPLNGRHPEYFSEDPYLTGIMAGNQSKGLEDHGVSSCLKHTVANNCESARKRNHSIISERAMREIYLKAFEVAIELHKPDAIMTGYNAANGVFTAEDEEMIQGVFREEFGFQGFVMTDWNSYDTADIVAAVQAGNSWMTPGSTDNTYVKPIVDGVRDGKIDVARLRSNIRYMLRVVYKRTVGTEPMNICSQDPNGEI